MNIININTFNEITINNKTLVICDIDETILKFDNINSKWWKDTFNYYYSLSNNYDYADNKTLECWKEFIINNKPKPTDYKGLINLFNNINTTNSELIFVTARSNDLINITNIHFKDINITNLNYKIYHIGDISKGEFIKLNILINEFNNVIFIDDLITNLESVYDNFNNKIILYKFEFI
jgi:hypothetical protein